MSTKTAIVTLFAAALVLTPLTGFAQGRGAGGGGGGYQRQPPVQVERGQHDIDRDRAQDRGRAVTPEHDRDRIQDRTHSPDFGNLKNRDIYGNEMMTKQEKKAYRKELGKAGSAEERSRVEAAHRHEMQVRAERQGAAIEPPGNDIYGGAQMSVEERNTYREQLRLIGSDREERTRFMADHKEKMQLRAKAQGDFPDNDIEEAE